MNPTVAALARNYQNTQTDLKTVTYTSILDDEGRLTDFEVPLLDSIGPDDLFEVSLTSLTTQWRPEPFSLTKAVSVPVQVFQTMAMLAPKGISFALSTPPSVPSTNAFSDYPLFQSGVDTVLDANSYKPVPIENKDITLTLLPVDYEPPTVSLTKEFNFDCVFNKQFNVGDQQSSIQMLSYLINEEVKKSEMFDFNTWWNLIPKTFRAPSYSPVGNLDRWMRVFAESSDAMANVFQNTRTVGKILVRNGRLGLKASGFQPFAFLNSTVCSSISGFDPSLFPQDIFSLGGAPFGYLGVFWNLSIDFFDEIPFTVYSSNGTIYRKPSSDKVRIAKMMGFPHDYVFSYDCVSITRSGYLYNDDIMAIIATWSTRGFVFDIIEPPNTDLSKPVSWGVYGYTDVDNSPFYVKRVPTQVYIVYRIYKYNFNAARYLIRYVNLPYSTFINDVSATNLNNYELNLFNMFINISLSTNNDITISFNDQINPLISQVNALTIPVYPLSLNTLPLNTNMQCNYNGRNLFLNFLISIIYNNPDLDYFNNWGFLGPNYIPDFFLEDKELNLFVNDARWTSFGGAIVNGVSKLLLQSVFMTQANVTGAYQQTVGFDNGTTYPLTGGSPIVSITKPLPLYPAYPSLEKRFLVGQRLFPPLFNGVSCVISAVSFQSNPSNYTTYSVANFSGIQIFNQAQPIVLILNTTEGDFVKSIKLSMVNSKGEKINNIALFSGARPTTQVVLQYKIWPGYYNILQKNSQVRLNPMGSLPVVEQSSQLKAYAVRRRAALQRARARRGR
jgi:hypothetical protein